MVYIGKVLCLLYTSKIWQDVNCHLISLDRDTAGVAQLVERKALNLVVKGSSPFFGGIYFLLCLLFCLFGLQHKHVEAPLCR